jgi:hypothetical protein
MRFLLVPALILVLAQLLNLSFRRWKPARVPRRRDTAPEYLQLFRCIRAYQKRNRRGLRYPTARDRRAHAHFLTSLKRTLNAR